MTAHQDVAGVVVELSKFDRDVLKIMALATEMDDEIRRLSKALSEAEAEIARLKEVDSTFNELASYSNTLAARAEAAESRLAEAMKVIEPFAAIQVGMEGDGEWFRHDGDVLHVKDFRAASRFLNAGKE